MELTRIEVSDLYDSFHQIAEVLFTQGEFPDGADCLPAKLGPRFDELVDQLEADFFFAACARRLLKTTGLPVQTDGIHKMLNICNMDGELLKGSAAQYHSHAFDYDWGTPYDRKHVRNFVICGGLEPRPRPDVRIFLYLDKPAEQAGA